MQQVTNIKELEKAINENGEMIISKTNDKIIIMDLKEYKENLLRKDIEKHLLNAEEDIKNARVRDARDVFKEWKTKYGI